MTDNSTWRLTADFKMVIKKFGEYRVEGNELKFDCPECGRGSRRFNLYVNVKKGVYHCFKCKWSGSFKPAPMPKKPVNFGLETTITSKIPGFVPLRMDRSGHPAYQYARGRGLSHADVLRMRLGYSNDRRYEDRLIIPVMEDDEFVYFVARSTSGQEPKELSPSKAQGWMPRSEVVYGLDAVPVDTDTVVVVEGVFDAERVCRGGFKAVALLGSSLSDVQLGKIMSKRPRRIALMFDPDEGGRHGQLKAVAKCITRFRGDVREILLPEGVDPDELTDAALQRLMEEKCLT